MEKCGVLHFAGNNLRNGASYALDQYRTLRGNRVQNRMVLSMGSMQNHVWKPSNSAVITYLKALNARLTMLYYLSIC